MDARTAQAAGVDFAGVTTGTTSRTELQAYPNVVVAQGLDELDGMLLCKILLRFLPEIPGKFLCLLLVCIFCEYQIGLLQIQPDGFSYLLSVRRIISQPSKRRVDTCHDSMIGVAGCGPTCMTMAYLCLTGDASMDPRKMASFASEKGYHTEAGTSWNFFNSFVFHIVISHKPLI